MSDNEEYHFLQEHNFNSSPVIKKVTIEYHEPHEEDIQEDLNLTAGLYLVGMVHMLEELIKEHSNNELD